MSVPHSADPLPELLERATHSPRLRAGAGRSETQARVRSPTAFWEVALCAAQLRRSRSEDAKYPAADGSSRHSHSSQPVFSPCRSRRRTVRPAAPHPRSWPATGSTWTPTGCCRARPTRQVNSLIAPGGYVGTWLRNNGATHSLAALYGSADTVQPVYGLASQQISGTAQQVANTAEGVSGDACLLDSDISGGCRRRRDRPRRSGALRRLCLLFPVIRLHRIRAHITCRCRSRCRCAGRSCRSRRRDRVRSRCRTRLRH